MLSLFNQKPYIKLAHFFIIILFTFPLVLSLDTCPPDKPILKDNTCQNMYCSSSDFILHNCQIKNEVIQTQWLNNFHVFDDDYTSHVSANVNKYGDIFLTAQETVGVNNKYIIGFSKDGNGLFYNQTTDSFYSFKKIKMPLREYADNLRYINLKGEDYLIRAPTDDDIYLIDYINDEYIDFYIKPASQGYGDIFELSGYEDDYFTSYIFCNDTFNVECYFHLKIFALNFDKRVIIDINSKSYPIVYGVHVNCIENDDEYIQCMYTLGNKAENSLYTRYVSLFDPMDLSLSFNFKIEETNFNNVTFFDSMIKLKYHVYIIAYTSEENKIRVLLKNITVDGKDENCYMTIIFLL